MKFLVGASTVCFMLTSFAAGAFADEDTVGTWRTSSSLRVRPCDASSRRFISEAEFRWSEITLGTAGGGPNPVTPTILNIARDQNAFTDSASDAIQIDAPANARFRQLGVVEIGDEIYQTLVYEPWGGLESNPSTVQTRLTLLSRDGSVRLCVPISELDDVALEQVYQVGDVTFSQGPVIIPFKVRPGVSGLDPTVQTDVSVEYGVGTRIRLHPTKERFIGLFAAFGVGSVNISRSELVDISDETEFDAQDVGALSWGGGVSFWADQVSASLMVGWDQPLGFNDYDWVYERRPYVGLSFGAVIAPPESAASTTNGGQ